MFSQIGERHASIQGRQGLYQVIPIQDGVVVGSSKVIQGLDPKVRWKPEIVFFLRNEALDSGVEFPDPEWRPRIGSNSVTPLRNISKILCRSSSLGPDVTSWSGPKVSHGFRFVAVEPLRLPGVPCTRTGFRRSAERPPQGRVLSQLQIVISHPETPGSSGNQRTLQRSPSMLPACCPIWTLPCHTS